MERLPDDCGTHADRCRQLVSYQDSNSGTACCAHTHIMAERGFKVVCSAQEQHLMVHLALRMSMCSRVLAPY